jgi:uncharacterized protein YdeI (BOF family)
VSGTVKSGSDDAFRLEHGGEVLLVEMDDWDWYSEARPLQAGQHVSVTGVIDDDLFEKRTLEARSVYVQELGTFYYARAADEEDRLYPYGGHYWGFLGSSSAPQGAALTGRVKSVKDRRFVLDTGESEVTVDTSAVKYRATDGRRLQAGDRVRITGTIDRNLFDKREINATTLVVMRTARD